MEQEDPFVIQALLNDFRLVQQASDVKAEMEELHKTHKDTPVGWLLLLQDLMGAWRARKATTRLWCEPPAKTPPGDLHHLAAPH